MSDYNNIIVTIDFCYFQRFRWVELPNRGETVAVDLVALHGPRGQVGEKRVYFDALVFKDELAQVLDSKFNTAQRDVKNCWGVGIRLSFADPKAYKSQEGLLKSSNRGRLIGAHKISIGNNAPFYEEPLKGSFQKKDDLIDVETKQKIAILLQKGYIFDPKSSRFVRGVVK